MLVDEKKVTVEASFKAEKANGTVDVTFVFYGEGLTEHELVMFEKLFTVNGEIEIEVTSYEDMVFILYLAVNDRIRLKGYGGQILQYVKKHAAGKNIVLNVESINPISANAEQRKKRISFYQRNGIEDTGYTFTDKDEAEEGG